MSHRSHKYPKQYKCCNDTITGCGLLCCQKCDKFAVDNILQTDEKDAENHFVFEKAIDSTVKSINSNWSWASAGLLAAAAQATITFNENGLSTVAKSWIYFLIIFIVGILVVVAQHSFESPEHIAKELQVKVPQTKAALGDKIAAQKEKDIIQKAETIQITNDKDTAMTQILNFVQIEGNILLENTENLFIAILSNVIALALNDAAGATFESILSDTKAAGTAILTAQWVYVVVLILINCFGAVKLGQYIDKLDIKMFDDMQQKGIENSKALLLRHATVKRILKLFEHCQGLVVAWALGDAMKSTILSLYGGSGTDSTIAALWTYAITATLIVTYTNTLNDRYYLLYPKDTSVGLQFDTAERKMIGNILYKNTQTIVGIAWYNVLLESPEKLSDYAIEKHRIWILWLEAVILFLLSGLISGYWSVAKMKFMTKQKGPVAALFLSFEDWFDPKHILDEGKTAAVSENNNGKDKVNRNIREAFWLEYFGQLLELIIFSGGFAAGWLIAAAVKATLVKTYAGVYDTEQVTHISKDVLWSVWLAFFISLVISALIMTFLSRFVSSLRDKKHQIFDAWRKELKEKGKIIERELETLNVEKNNDGKTHNITDDVKEESEHENDENKAFKTEIEMK